MPPGGVPILASGRRWVTAENKERTSVRGTASASLQALPASALTDISRRERSPRGAADGMSIVTSVGKPLPTLYRARRSPTRTTKTTQGERPCYVTLAMQQAAP